MATRTENEIPVELQEVLSFFSSAIKSLWRLSLSTTKYIPIPLRPTALLALGVSAVYYALSPLTLLVSVTADVLIYTPFYVLGYVFDALQPVYAFVGAAVIVGSVLGLIARVVSNYVAAYMMRTGPFESRAQKKVKTGRWS
ncbi:hypothetical protein FISHEDRAFT_78631 [Fistulina hepatica ATCC 64428]|uniref:Uncharacterized protein n=1 Tax=Fistulina hepatica ATCC 64428 TaxID=1128425 RepID=A0A0D7A2W1_9AGAR|nr:hypothetical protein FISHEDRAFT_78631 [Fistulina hepatica ATCC 64428]